MAYQFTDRETHLPATASELRRRFEDDHWWMTDAERLALYGLLSELRPACAIEVGVYRAGSLGVLSRFCGKVYALDVDPDCKTLFSDKFANVEFVTGDSRITLPHVLQRIEAAGEELGFVLIDADHSREGVQRDINHVLCYTPSRPLYVLTHDSFNPECRKGIRDADWSSNSHVHLVELDFVTGQFDNHKELNAERQMWCGFALAILLPEDRTGAVAMHANESLAFETVRRSSVHRGRAWWNPLNMPGEISYAVKRLLRRRAPGLYGALRHRLRPTMPERL